MAVFSDLANRFFFFLFFKFIVIIIEILSEGICRPRHILMCQVEAYFDLRYFKCILFS